MGRGDRKTKKGKIFRGSSGNSRMKNKKSAITLSQPEVKKTAPKKVAAPAKKLNKETPVKKAAVEKKAPEKKPAAKKTTTKKDAEK